MARFLHFFSILILILGLIGSIVLANKLGLRIETTETGTYYKYTYTSEVRDSGLTAVIFFSGTISTLIIFGTLQALSRVLDELEEQKNKLWEIADLLKKEKDGK